MTSAECGAVADECAQGENPSTADVPAVVAFLRELR
jgi:hypothetical protein